MDLKAHQKHQGAFIAAENALRKGARLKKSLHELNQIHPTRWLFRQKYPFRLIFQVFAFTTPPIP
jgi:hypothetical protein